MKINPEKCIGCKSCLELCVAGAIRERTNHSSSVLYVSEEMCFECGLCLRLRVCPRDAFEESESTKKFPRVVRAFFSNPNTTHKLTLVPGRGTEESKTNDVTGRVKRGEVGICIEMGRPGLGSRFEDISLMTSRLKTLGAQFEPQNPLTTLMEPETGHFSESVLSQRILSAIIEIKLDNLADLQKVIPVIMEVSQKIDTVFSLSFISRFEEDGELLLLEYLAKLGLSIAPNAKINLGLGKPLVER